MCPFQPTRTFWALMVMPRSRSRSIESRYCARMSRASTAPGDLEDAVATACDLPWSMWAMIEKLRMRSRSMAAVARPLPAKVGADGSGCSREPVEPPIARDPATPVQSLEVRRPRGIRPWRTSRARRSATSPTPRRAERNKAVKSELKTRVKTAIEGGRHRERPTRPLRLAVKRLDMAAAKGVIHPNQAARRKSRLMKKLNAAG